MMVAATPHKEAKKRDLPRALVRPMIWRRAVAGDRPLGPATGRTGRGQDGKAW
jgi:hypothetical protein